MTTTRTISTVTITVARDSMGGIDMNEYLSRLESAVRSLPDLHEDAEVNISEADVTKYEGLYSDSQPYQHDAMTDRLNALAEDVYSAMRTSRSYTESDISAAKADYEIRYATEISRGLSVIVDRNYDGKLVIGFRLSLDSDGGQHGCDERVGSF